MSQLDEVESLLQQLSGEGELSSRGRFTLDASKSRQKIGQFLENDPASWSNWWVRGLHALGASSLHLQLGRQMLLLTAAFPSDSLGLESLSAFLTRGDDPTDAPGLALMRNGLLWLQALMGSHSDLQVSLLLQDCGLDCGFWKLTQQGLEVGPVPSGTDQPLLRLTLQGQHLQVLRSQLAAVLPPRLAYSTFPVVLDGRALNPTPPDGDLLYARYYLGRGGGDQLVVPAPSALQAHRYTLNVPGEHHPRTAQRPRLATPASRVADFSLAGYLPPDTRWSSEEGQPLLTFQSGGQNQRLCLLGASPLPLAEGWGEEAPPWRVPVAFFRSFAGPDQMVVVDRGLCLEPTLLRLAGPRDYGWKALVARDDIPTDLSGIKAVEDAHYAQMLAWVDAEIREIHALPR